jgi:hypothetical protein
MEFEGESSDAVADGHVGDFFELPCDFFEEEVVLLPWDLGEGVLVSVYLAFDGV